MLKGIAQLLVRRVVQPLCRRKIEKATKHETTISLVSLRMGYENHEPLNFWAARVKGGTRFALKHIGESPYVAFMQGIRGPMKELAETVLQCSGVFYGQKTLADAMVEIARLQAITYRGEGGPIVVSPINDTIGEMEIVSGHFEAAWKWLNGERECRAQVVDFSTDSILSSRLRRIARANGGELPTPVHCSEAHGFKVRHSLHSFYAGAIRKHIASRPTAPHNSLLFVECGTGYYMREIPEGAFPAVAAQTTSKAELEVAIATNPNAAMFHMEHGEFRNRFCKPGSVKCDIVVCIGGLERALTGGPEEPYSMMDTLDAATGVVLYCTMPPDSEAFKTAMVHRLHARGVSTLLPEHGKGCPELVAFLR